MKQVKQVKQVKIETERLVLRDYELGDLDALHSLLSDTEHMYYLDDIATHSVEESAANLRAVMANADGHYFCVTHKESGAFVGSVGYTITDDAPKVVHMGYFILPKFEGRGYTTEAVRRVLDFAFNNDNCQRVTTGCYKDNAASRRIMEKVGFRPLFKHSDPPITKLHDGRMKERLEYAMDKT